MGLLNNTNIDISILKSLHLENFIVKGLKRYRGEPMLFLRSKCTPILNYYNDFNIIRGLGFEHVYFKIFKISTYINDPDFLNTIIHCDKVEISGDKQCTGIIKNLIIYCGSIAIDDYKYLLKCKNIYIRSNVLIIFDPEKIDYNALQNDIKIQTNKLSYYWPTYKHNRTDDVNYQKNFFLQHKNIMNKFHANTLFNIYQFGGIYITNKKSGDLSPFEWWKKMDIDNEYAMYRFEQNYRLDLLNIIENF